MKLDVYLNYHGNCELAFRFYEQHLGGKILMMMRHGENPAPNPNIDKDWHDKVLHAQIEIGGTALMGADIPHAEGIRSAYLTLTVDTIEEADRIYNLLTDGGQVFIPMQETFYAARFGMFRDRFGTSWMLLGEPREPSR
jgi:PhnB protein